MKTSSLQVSRFCRLFYPSSDSSIYCQSNRITHFSLSQAYVQAMYSINNYFGEFLISHIASSKEDCLAKLMEYGLLPEGLPVSLGGSWTDGWEPWRDCHGDDDQVTLEIETDLSCLCRNTLWSYNQVRKQQQQQEPQQPKVHFHRRRRLLLLPVSIAPQAVEPLARLDDNDDDHGDDKTMDAGRILLGLKDPLAPPTSVRLKRPRVNEQNVDDDDDDIRISHVSPPGRGPSNQAL